MSASREAVARELLDVVPVIMRTIRTEMRSHRSNDLTMPLFRTLMFLERHPGVSLLDLARHLGLTSPSVCKIVDGLVEHSLVMRQHSNTDRRKITLALTDEGQNVLDGARTSAQARLAELLIPLSAEQCETVFDVLQIIQPLFMATGDKIISGEKKI
ncbi:MAG: MarR family transcriptional regulator [Anaerolineales bacterium]|jgi:DNA-binding MarR family transcriptional regulator